MARRAFLGIDCGTQSTKALLLDAETLVPLALGRAHHDLIARDDGTREQHPDWWRSALQAATRQAFAGVSPGSIDVAGIGVSGQQHGMVCLDAEDHPVRPAKLWNDTTTEPDCAWLTRKLGGLDAVLALTGNAFLPGYTTPKVSWFHRSEPDADGQTARICLPHDYLNLWLTGEYVAEPGDASGTGYFDVRARTYQADVLTLLDADRAWERTLPPVGPSLSQIGGLRPATAEALGLAPGTPVSAGGVFELPVQRPAVSEAAALGAALQVRRVVDGVGPPAALLDATWEPRPSDALRATRDRTAELRQLAAEHAL